tara:strand:- start:135 stop:350 length:216 start_codon:yes stop_codon:yes gene_type:complete
MKNIVNETVDFNKNIYVTRYIKGDVTKYLPNCDVSNFFCDLMGRTHIAQDRFHYIRDLGFKIMIKEEEVTE